MCLCIVADKCKTIAPEDHSMGNAAPNSLCMFPFVFNNKSHVECKSSKKGSWCMVEDLWEWGAEAGKHKWGMCNDKCPEEDTRTF